MGGGGGRGLDLKFWFRVWGEQRGQRLRVLIRRGPTRNTAPEGCYGEFQGLRVLCAPEP